VEQIDARVLAQRVPLADEQTHLEERYEHHRRSAEEEEPQRHRQVLDLPEPVRESRTRGCQQEQR